MTIEERQHRPAPPPTGVITYVRSCSPLIRPLKIRPRPSSSFNLNDRDCTGERTRTLTKHFRHFFFFRSTLVKLRWGTSWWILRLSISLWIPESNYSEYFSFSFNWKLNFLFSWFQVQRDHSSIITTDFHDAATSTDDLQIPQPIRPCEHLFIWFDSSSSSSFENWSSSSNTRRWNTNCEFTSTTLE